MVEIRYIWVLRAIKSISTLYLHLASLKSEYVCSYAYRLHIVVLFNQFNMIELLPDIWLPEMFLIMWTPVSYVQLNSMITTATLTIIWTEECVVYHKILMNFLIIKDNNKISIEITKYEQVLAFVSERGWWGRSNKLKLKYICLDCVEQLTWQ